MLPLQLAVLDPPTAMWIGHSPFCRYHLAQRILRQNYLDQRRLAMIPFCTVVNTIRANYTMLCSNFVPQLGIRRARPTNSVHVHGKAIGMKRVEFISEATDTEGG